MSNKMQEPLNPKRREALLKIGQNTGFALFGALLWGAYINVAKAGNANILRPPGASKNDAEFIANCIKCGLCVESCPFYTLRLATSNDETTLGTPLFEPRKVPCYMCEDIPCAAACPTSALDIKRLYEPKKPEVGVAYTEPSINNATMGVAVVDSKHCVAYAGIQCDACYRACPLIDKAIVLEYKRNERTGKHGFLLPVVDSDYCTGCGKCEKACVTELPTIIVLPRSVVLGKMGTNYIKGWDKLDENRLFELKEQKNKPKALPNETLDYLNSSFGDL